MTAATAVDPSGVEYYFECVSGPGSDSGWQTGAVYVDTNLAENESYTYRVKARDLSDAHNETDFSAEATVASNPDLNPNNWIAVYHPSYQWDHISEIPWDNITHLILGYLWPSSSNTGNGFTLAMPSSVSWSLSEWISRAKPYVDEGHQQGKKITCMLGGAGSNPGSRWNLATASNEITAFANNIKSILKDQAGFDGVDLDWEDGVDYPLLVNLAAKLREVWPDAIITIPTGMTGSDASQLAPAKDYVDAFMPMSYISIPQWGGWIIPIPLTPIYSFSTNPYSFDSIFQKWIAAGVPASQIVMGVGGSGAVWGDSNADGIGPNSPYCSTTSGYAEGERSSMASDNVVTQKWLDDLLTDNPGVLTEGWDDVGKCSYWYSASTNTADMAIGNYWNENHYISLVFYETPRSISEKSNYIKSNNMKGMMFWTLSQMVAENGSYPILEAIDITTTPTIDDLPPAPNPMTWQIAPYVTDTNSISMTATTATDPSGVEYYFECVNGPGNDSGWQSGSVYVDANLPGNESFTYRVKARDLSDANNETDFSAEVTVSTDPEIPATDDTPPAPNPMTWLIAPHLTGTNSISMTAATATDPSGVEYYFECVSGPGSDSGWQSGSVYVDTNLPENESFTYRVKARDLSDANNETDFSAEVTVTTNNPANEARTLIISPETMGKTTENINGPSLIRIPDWIPTEQRADPEANYYLYFANHGGSYIRMAWAKNVLGPYTIYNRGTQDNKSGVLDYHEINNQTQHMKIGYHIASPDVHVDAENHRIIMYYHSDMKWNNAGVKGSQGQFTGVAVSDDGLDFSNGVVDMIICSFYARVFSHGGELYAFTRFGDLWKARDPNNPWENQTNVDIINNGGVWELISTKSNRWDDVYNPFEAQDMFETGSGIRHLAVGVRGDNIDVFYSLTSTAPEHIAYSKVDFSSSDIYHLDRATGPISVIKPVYDWEGADLPINTSTSGGAMEVHQLRDPYLFTDIDGKDYLLYSTRGECGIGIVLLSDVFELE
jgi:GH18 family chitinase